MSVRLLPLTDGFVSLEFETADIERVAATLVERFGPPSTEEFPILTVYRLAGLKFVFQNEWDDPCLLSCGAEGSRLLAEIAVALGGPHDGRAPLPSDGGNR